LLEISSFVILSFTINGNFLRRRFSFTGFTLDTQPIIEQRKIFKKKTDNLRVVIHFVSLLQEQEYQAKFYNTSHAI